MLFEIGIYRLDVDVERTKSYYAALGGTGCECAGCRNYKKASAGLTEPIQGFLRQFGIDPQNPIEMSVLYSPDGNETLYNGFFHICGTILTGNDPWIQTGPKSRMLNQDYLIALTAESSAYIIEDCSLVDDIFPRPVIQLEITFTLPWLLDEPNPYQ